MMTKAQIEILSYSAQYIYLGYLLGLFRHILFRFILSTYLGGQKYITIEIGYSVFLLACINQ